MSGSDSYFAVWRIHTSACYRKRQREKGKQVNAEWTLTDKLTAVGIIVAALGVLATLFTPQFQRWRRSRRNQRSLVTLGNLSDSELIDDPAAAGILKADKLTLEAIQTALPSRTIEWIHEHDFGNGFWWKFVLPIEEFNSSYTGPEHEFLDEELESLRQELRRWTQEFIHLVSWHTAAVDKTDTFGYRKIPDQYDERGKYSDEPFFRKSKEINDVADKVWSTYQSLVRRARIKLALGGSTGQEIT